MFQRHRLQLLDRYQMAGHPRAHGGPTNGSWVEEAVRPYVATRIPTGTGTGLAPVAPALRAAVTAELVLA